MSDSDINLSPFKIFIAHIICRLESEKAVFERVRSDWENEGDLNALGNLSFAMACSALAAFDAVAAVIRPQAGNKERVIELIKDANYFNPALYGNEHVFYHSIRCGLMHEAHPVNMHLTNRGAYGVPVIRNGNEFTLNAHALYVDVLRGLKVIKQTAEVCKEFCDDLDVGCRTFFQNPKNQPKPWEKDAIKSGLNALPEYAGIVPTATAPPRDASTA